MGLYERIRDLAKLKGYSVNRLEQELGFARSSISKFNKNKPAFYDGEALYPETAKLFREDLLIAIERLKIINKAKSICELKKD